MWSLKKKMQQPTDRQIIGRFEFDPTKGSFVPTFGSAGSNTNFEAIQELLNKIPRQVLTNEGVEFKQEDLQRLVDQSQLTLAGEVELERVVNQGGLQGQVEKVEEIDGVNQKEQTDRVTQQEQSNKVTQGESSLTESAMANLKNSSSLTQKYGSVDASNAFSFDEFVNRINFLIQGGLFPVTIVVPHVHTNSIVIHYRALNYKVSVEHGKVNVLIVS